MSNLTIGCLVGALSLLILGLLVRRSIDLVGWLDEREIYLADETTGDPVDALGAPQSSIPVVHDAEVPHAER